MADGADTFSYDDCIALITSELNDDTLQSMLLTLDRQHILAIAYLIHEGVYGKSEIEKYLTNRTFYPRETELLKAISSVVSDNMPFDIFSGLYNAISKTKKNKVNAKTIDETVNEIQNIKIPVNPCRVSYTDSKNINPKYTLPEFELMRAQYANLFKYVSIPMPPAMYATLVTSPKAIERYRRFYNALSMTWREKPFPNNFYDYLYRGYEYDEDGKRDTITFIDNDDYSGFLNAALFELMKNGNDGKYKDDTSTMLDELLRKSISCSASYALSTNGKEKYTIAILTIFPPKALYSSFFSSMNAASLFAVYDNPSLVSADIANKINSVNCDYLGLSLFGDRQREVYDALVNKRIDVSELNNTYSNAYPTAITESQSRFITRLVTYNDELLSGFSNNQILKKKYSANAATSSSRGSYGRIKYSADMSKENIKMYISNDFVIDSAYNIGHYHNLVTLGSCNLLSIVNKIINNFVDENNLSFTMNSISNDKDVLKDKIVAIKTDIYKNFTLDPFTSDEMPLVAIAYETVMNYLNFLIVGNSMYDTNHLYTLENDIITNFDATTASGTAEETDFEIKVSDNLYASYKYLHFMRGMLINIPVLNEYMNSDSEVLKQYRDFLNFTAFRSIVNDLHVKYDKEFEQKGLYPTWGEIYKKLPRA